MKWALSAVAALAVIAAVVAVVSVFAGGSAAPVVTGPAKTKRIGGPLLRDPSAYLAAARGGDVMFGLAARPGRVELVIVPSDITNVPPRAVRATAGGRSVRLSRCGDHCIAFDAPVLRGSPVRIVVSVKRHGGALARAALQLPARVAPAAPALLRSVAGRMDALRGVRVAETLSSGQAALRSRFSFQAPNRMTYVTSAGDKAIQIGARRWDWDQGTRRWQRSESEVQHEPTYIWTGAQRPRRLGRFVLAGQQVTVLAVFRPDLSYPAWFRLYVTGDRRVVRAEMIAPAHFMVDRYSSFNGPLAIRPPG